MSVRRAVGVLLLAGPLVVGTAMAQGFKFSDPDPAQQADRRPPRPRARIASPTSCPRPAAPTSRARRSWSIIGERQSDGYVLRAAAELRPAFPGDQLRGCARSGCAPSRRKRSARRSSRPRSTPTSGTIPTARFRRPSASAQASSCAASSPPRRRQNPMMAVNQVDGLAWVSPSPAATASIVSDVGADPASYAGAERRTDGAHARQRAGRRGGGQALWRLLPQRGLPAGTAPKKK